MQTNLPDYNSLLKTKLVQMLIKSRTGYKCTMQTKMIYDKISFWCQAHCQSSETYV